MALNQVPLRQVLDFKPMAEGKYEFEFPISVCFGAVVSGGLVMSAIHRAAVHFAFQNSQTDRYPNVSNISIQFYRPTLPTPRKFLVELRVSDVNRAGATFHVEVTQKKTTIAGYVSMANLAENNNTFKGLDCKLIPPPIATTISNLENDVEDGWSGYRLPFSLGHNRWGVTYIQYHIPNEMQSLHYIDQWLRPAWKDDTLPNGPVWTNELVHFLLDSSKPLWLDPDTSADVYRKSVQAGIKQSKARREGSSELVDGGDLVVPYIVATLTMNVTVRRLLPPEGERWLLMRTSTTGHANDRADFYVVLMNSKGQVVATCNQVMLLMPHAKKDARL